MLRPRSISDTIRVSCEPPASQALMWSQQSDIDDGVIVTAPKSRSLNNTSAVYVLVNSNHYVRLLMLDK